MNRPDSPRSNVTFGGFWWRIDAREKVLLFDREPVGGVRHSAPRFAAATPWYADRLSPTAQKRFASEGEAIAYVEGAMASYMEWKRFVATPPRAPYRHADAHAAQQHAAAR